MICILTMIIVVLNFTHRIDELSFGEFYPNLINPLDNSMEIAETRKVINFVIILCLYLFH